MRSKASFCIENSSFKQEKHAASATRKNMYIDDKGIVLRTVKYDDKSFIAHVFTCSRGHAAFIVNGSRGKRGGIARLFQSLTILNFQWDMRPTASLHRMKEVRLGVIQQSIPVDPTKRSIAMLLAEFMCHTLSNEAENADLYTYIEFSLQWIDTAVEGYANFHLVFLLKLARFLGIAPDMGTYSEGDFFDLTRSKFVPYAIPSDTVMSSADAQLFFQLGMANYETMRTIAMNRHDRVRMLRYIERYYALHIPKFPAIQSIEILQTLFDA